MVNVHVSVCEAWKHRVSVKVDPTGSEVARAECFQLFCWCEVDKSAVLDDEHVSKRHSLVDRMDRAIVQDKIPLHVEFHRRCIENSNDQDAHSKNDGDINHPDGDQLAFVARESWHDGDVVVKGFFFVRRLLRAGFTPPSERFVVCHCREGRAE